MKALSVICGALAAIVTLVGVWTWALLGMSPEVGAAVYVTATVLAVGSFASLIAWDSRSTR